MKTVLPVLFALIACITFSAITATAAAASYPVAVNPKPSSFQFLRAHRQGSAISLSWAFDVSGADQFVVERSYDGEFFDMVESVAPVTGTNTYLDSAVFPGTIHYRIVAVDASGNTQYSPVTVVRLIRRG
jgi:hypothetical protein